MKWTTMAVGLMATGLLGGCATAQTGPFTASSAYGESAPVQTVQYYQSYGYGVENDYYEPYGRTYRGYRDRPSYGYGYYGRPRYDAPRYGYRDYLQDRKEVIREQRDAQKELFKKRQRAWNRAHGFD